MANRWWSGGKMMEPSSGSPGMEKRIDQHGGDEEVVEEDEQRDDHGAVVEVGSRRPRGRPAGSKNKPKPPIYVTRDGPNALRSHVMEIAAGADVAGRFEILSLAGSYLPGHAPPGATGLTVYLSAGQGQVVGGGVVGTLIASGPVMVIAATFGTATFERLPLEEDEQNNQQDHEDAGRGGGGQGLGNSPPAVGSGGSQHQLHDLSMHMPVYNLPPNLLPNNGGGVQLNHDAYAWADARPPF